MKAYQTPEIAIQRIAREDIMTNSGEFQSYFMTDGIDTLFFNWSELGINTLE